MATKRHYDQPVELRNAFAWWCHDCGEENYISPTFLCLPPEEEEEMREEMGMRNAQDEFRLVKVPEKVRCGFCDAEFEVE